MTTSVLAIDAGPTAAACAGLRNDLVELLERALNMATSLDEDIAALHIQWAIEIAAQPVSAMLL